MYRIGVGMGEKVNLKLEDDEKKMYDTINDQTMICHVYHVSFLGSETEFQKSRVGVVYLGVW